MFQNWPKLLQFGSVWGGDIVHSVSSSRRFCKGDDHTDQSYSAKKCRSWFQEYASSDDPDVIGPEGMERFCQDISVEPENIVMLVIAWKMDAKRMGYFTRQEWIQGLSDLQCDAPQKLRAKLESLRSLLNDISVFKNIYRYAFEFAKDSSDRNMDIDTAKAMLQLLLGRQWPLFGNFYHFLEQSRYKIINKDQWYNILEFSRAVLPDLTNYDEDGAWPVLMDEFVEWLRTNQGQVL